MSCGLNKELSQEVDTHDLDRLGSALAFFCPIVPIPAFPFWVGESYKETQPNKQTALELKYPLVNQDTLWRFLLYTGVFRRPMEN